MKKNNLSKKIIDITELAQEKFLAVFCRFVGDSLSYSKKFGCFRRSVSTLVAIDLAVFPVINTLMDVSG